jgi:hypothetical protein
VVPFWEFANNTDLLAQHCSPNLYYNVGINEASVEANRFVGDREDVKVVLQELLNESNKENVHQYKEKRLMYKIPFMWIRVSAELCSLLFLFCIPLSDAKKKLDACQGMSLEQLKQINTISEDCKQAVQSLLPSMENNVTKSFIALGRGLIDGKKEYFFCGADTKGTPLSIVNRAQLSVTGFANNTPTVLDTTEYVLRRLNEFGSTIISLSCVIDYSGSMGNQDLSDAIEVYTDLFSALKLATGFEANIIAFTDSVMKIFDFSADATRLRDNIQMDTTIKRGTTALFDAMGMGLNALSARQTPVRLLIVATDGQENASKKYTNKEQLYSICKAHGIPIIILGALFSDISFMRETAIETGGLYIYNRAFLQIKKDFLQCKDILVNAAAIELQNAHTAWDSLYIEFGGSKIRYIQ